MVNRNLLMAVQQEGREGKEELILKQLKVRTEELFT